MHTNCTQSALLPRDLFEKRMGRAAMRLLGISYRQAKMGSSSCGKIEDHGWQLLTTATHKDKISYKEVDLFSTTDNQNKELVRVYRGVDPVTGEQRYELHPRLAQAISSAGKAIKISSRSQSLVSAIDRPRARGSGKREM